MNWIEDCEVSKKLKEHEPSPEEQKRLESRTKLEELTDTMNRLNAVEGDLDKSIYDCKICKNRGYVNVIKRLPIQVGAEQREDDYMFIQRCPCMKIRDAIRRLRRSGFEQSLKKFSLDNFEANTEMRKI